MATAILAVLAGCGSKPLDDYGKIVQATLALQGRGRDVNAPALCVDRRTRGEPLTIFRTMALTRRDLDLRWRRPAPLRGQRPVSGRALFEDSIGRDRLRITVPASPDQILSLLDQGRLDAAARALLLADDSRTVTIDDRATAPGTVARWWMINRLHRDCSRVIVVSRVASNRDIGFVSLAADHWGTIYAVERRGADWQVTGQWGTWLY